MSFLELPINRTKVVLFAESGDGMIYRYEENYE